MHLCVFEDDHVTHFLPLVHTRAVYDLRLGMHTLLRALRDAFDDPPTILHARKPVASVTGGENDLLVNRIPEELDVLFVNGRWVVQEGPALDRVRGAVGESSGRVFVHGDDVIAAWIPQASSRLVNSDAVTRAAFEDLPEETLDGEVRLVKRLWSFIEELHDALVRDFRRYTKGLNIFERPGAKIGREVIFENGEDIYVGAGAVVRPGAVLNAEDGPIFVGEDARIDELAVVKGPAYIGPKSVIKTGADIDTCSFGYWTKVGGQVEDSIIHSLSNKAHAGFLGNAYVGRWCNIGADTTVSNLKNDYGEVYMYNTVPGDFEATGRQFLGLMMGDHAKCGINTMFNTGTVVGVCCNIFGAGFQPRVIPCFSWGGPEEFTEYRLDKALDVADRVMKRRDRELTESERENLETVFDSTREETIHR